MTTTLHRIRAAIPATIALVALSLSANAAVTIFSNNFETNTNGFSAGTAQTLPVDSGGFASVNTSKYLGLFAGDSQSGNVTFTDLTVPGLTAGTVYGVSFDLFAGRSLDGSGGPGPDRFTLSAGVTVGPTFTPSATLVDATFGNIGAVQSYSDATPTAGLGGSNASLTGADQSFAAGSTFGNYGIYYFSHGASTNPQLSFLASGPTATLRFAVTNLQPAEDEFFAYDNVIITAPDQPGDGRVPDSGTTLFLLGGALLTIVCIRRLAIA